MEELKNLIQELGLDTLSEKNKQDLVVSLAESLQMRISTRILVMLTEEEKDEFDKLTENHSDEKAVTEFLVKKIPNYDNILVDEYLKFREEILETNSKVKERQKTAGS